MGFLYVYDVHPPHSVVHQICECPGDAVGTPSCLTHDFLSRNSHFNGSIIQCSVRLFVLSSRRNSRFTPFFSFTTYFFVVVVIFVFFFCSDIAQFSELLYRLPVGQRCLTIRYLSILNSSTANKNHSFHSIYPIDENDFRLI